jgi:hypothetical protein
MGTRSSLSTLSELIPYVTLFSGKLSPVMPNSTEPAVADQPVVATAALPKPREVGGREGPEPTRFGDWELRGRCIDF